MLGPIAFLSAAAVASFEPKLVSVPLVHRQPLGARRPGRHLLSKLAVTGSISDDYAAEVVIDGKTFHVIVDTGSDVFAVAAASDLGCDSYVDTASGCDHARPVKTVYGSGYWSGVQCWRDVRLGNLVVAGYELSAIEAESSFLTCSPERKAEMLRPDFVSEGIIGLSLDGLKGATNTSKPLLYALFATHPNVPRVFGLQCCAYDPTSGTGGTGAFDIGGADHAHYSGPFSWVQVVGDKWSDHPPNHASPPISQASRKPRANSYSIFSWSSLSSSLALAAQQHRNSHPSLNPCHQVGL